METNQSPLIADDPPSRCEPSRRQPSRRGKSRNALPENRESRDQEQRANQSRQSDYYGDTWDEVPMNFPMEKLPPRKGFVQRFMRTAVLGTEDPGNIMKNLAEGWKPRDPATVPAEFFSACIKVNIKGRAIDVIGNHDQVLMERPEHMEKAESDNRDQYHDNLEELLDEMLEGDSAQQLRLLKGGVGGTGSHKVSKNPMIADD